MVVRSSRDRRKRQVRQSICKTCVAFAAAIGLVVTPYVWERITSIASVIQKLPPNLGGRK